MASKVGCPSTPYTAAFPNKRGGETIEKPFPPTEDSASLTREEAASYRVRSSL